MLQPDDKLCEVGRRHLCHLQLVLSQKAVKPQEPGTVCLDGGRSVPGCRFPVQEQFYLWNEVQVGIDQVPHAPAIGGEGLDHLGRIHHSSSNALFQKERSLLSFFHRGFCSPKNMETTTERPPKQGRSFRCFPPTLFSR